MENFILQSQEINHISEAFAKAQGEYPKIGKDKSANTGMYTYRYAGLEDIFYSMLPILSKHGLSLWQGNTWKDGKTFLATILRHSSGQWFASYVPYIDKKEEPEEIIPTKNGHTEKKPKKKNPYQDFGGATTYLKRYQIISILCIHPDEDYDANDLQEVESVTLKSSKEEYDPINKNELDKLELELAGFPEIAERMKKHYRLEKLAHLSKDDFWDSIERIRKMKQIIAR